MSEKKKILIFIDWFLPGYKAGGPIRSIGNIVHPLSGLFDFYIITSDRDLGDKTPYSGIEFNTELKTKDYSVFYLSPENQNLKYYKKIIKEIAPNKIYINGLFSFKFSILPFFASKRTLSRNSLIVAPRGMLGEGALGIKKNKKRLFLTISKITKFFSGVTWHATTPEEKEDIITSFGKTGNIITAGNIPLIPDHYVSREKENEIRFVFISRISKKKNLLYAIELFKSVKTEKKIVFDIYGPSEDESYKEICTEEIRLLPENISVNFKGELFHNEVNTTLKKYHFFLFPTLHENYGHAVFEALSASCPVILSNQTPWRNLKEKNIGRDIPLSDKETFVEAIRECIDMSQNDYDKMSKNAFIFAKEFAETSEAVEQTKKLFA